VKINKVTTSQDDESVGVLTDSLSEIEFRTPYVVAERLIVALMLRFKPAKKVLSDTLRNGDLCAGAGAHCRSLGCARDDKWRVVTFIRGRQIGWTEKKQRVPPLRFTSVGMTISFKTGDFT
jgi:hypothetical protein